MNQTSPDDASPPPFREEALERFLDHLARLIARDHVRRSASQAAPRCATQQSKRSTRAPQRR